MSIWKKNNLYSIYSTQVAPVLMNATLGLEDWLKSKFYSHLSDKRVDVSNLDGQLRILAKVQPSLNAVDLMLYKPPSNTFFYDLPLSDLANIVFPLSGKSSLSERIVDHTVSDGFARNESHFVNKC